MKDAIILTVESVRTRASTSEALITFALPLEHAAHVSNFMSMIGQQVGAAFVPVDVHTQQKQGRPEDPPPSGNRTWRQEFRVSTFLRMPEVWKATGSDEQFLDWLRGQKCAYCGNKDYIVETGEEKCEAAHVRRVEHGSGASIKPPYSAISLCRKHHRLAHAQGDSELGDEDWWHKQRVAHLRSWVWDTIKSDIGVESMSELDKEAIHDWAAAREIKHLLPIYMLDFSE